MKLRSIILEKKRAVLGLDTAKLFVLAILSLVIVSVVTLIVLDSLKGATAAGSGTYNRSGEIIDNVSTALSNFFADAGTWFTLIGVVIIILIIAVVIVVVNRMGAGGMGSSGAFS